MNKQKGKLKTMKIGLILAASALVTCCAVGGTLSKFSVGNGSYDGARIAKFGVKIEANGAAFSRSYESQNTQMARMITNSVVSTDQVVAPGTSGKVATMTISGTPEVAVAVNYRATFAVTNWEDEEGNFYCPLEITVGETSIYGRQYTSHINFEEAVQNAIQSCSAEYEAGTDLSEAAIPVISWAWAFEGNDDIKDTYLGNQACKRESGISKAGFIVLEIITTVTQLN